MMQRQLCSDGILVSFCVIAALGLFLTKEIIQKFISHRLLR